MKYFSVLGVLGLHDFLHEILMDLLEINDGLIKRPSDNTLLLYTLSPIKSDMMARIL